MIKAKLNNSYLYFYDIFEMLDFVNVANKEEINKIIQHIFIITQKHEEYFINMMIKYNKYNENEILNAS